jgi:FtsZ-binding cell division protein ZapB
VTCYGKRREDGFVTNADGHLSARLRRARDRLELATDSLDSVLETRLEAAAEEDGARAEAGVARAENAELKQMAETVSERLDSTIGRLRAVLED